MLRARLLLFISTLFITFTACQKETSLEIPGNSPGNNNSGNNGPGNSNGSELGTWKFISMQANTSSTIEMIESGVSMKAVTTSEYTTTNNGGTIKFENSKMSYSGLTYSASGMAKGSLYIDGMLMNNSSLPFSGTVPPIDGAGDYKKIGTDSIYLQSNPLSVVESGGNVQSGGAGYKLKWNGNQMTMTLKHQETRDQDYLGTPAKEKIELEAVLTLEKQ